MFPNSPLATVEFEFIADGISQEPNETFTIHFQNIDSSFSYTAELIFDRLNGTIIDSDSMFQINTTIILTA